jgi:hypothetical protein
VGNPGVSCLSLEVMLRETCDKSPLLEQKLRSAKPG